LKALVGEPEQRDIETLVARVIRDLAKPEPPLNLDEVRTLLVLDRHYYSSTDVGLFEEFAHRIKKGGRMLKINAREQIRQVLERAGLTGLWVPDGRKIFVDQDSPENKHRWIETHEIAHSLIPWHQEFLMGDDELTLDPACHEVIEAEANFGAGRLLFLGARFAEEARSLPPTFKSVQALSDRFKNSLKSTFWRFVEDRDPSSLMVGLIGPHPKKVGKVRNTKPVESILVASDEFRKRFGNITRDDLQALVRKHATFKQRGPVFEVADTLTDVNGVRKTFAFEGFCNTYDLMTLGFTA
jgi:hypothetical protein